MKATLFLLLFSPFCFFSQTFSGTIGLVTDDGANNDFTASVSGLGSTTLNASFGLKIICVNMTHTYDSDMEILLIAPDGTNISLFNNIGGSDDDFTNTCFDQTSASTISSGTAPFTGTFKPMGNIGDANNGQNGNGTWTLRCIDHAGQDQGNLLSWDITFGSNAPAPLVYNSSNLPIVLLNSLGQTIQSGPKIPATMQIIWNGPGITNHITDVPNIYNGDIGIDIRGAYSASLPQKPYGVETRDSLGLEQNISLLGMPAEHDWVLIANYNDKAFVRNTLAYKLFSEMGHYAARMKFCEVYLNGQYQGIYLLGEKLKRDNNRINLSRLDTFENVMPDVSGGYIIKNDYYDGTNSWQSPFSPIDHPGFDVHFVYYYPKPDKITPQQQTYIQTFVNDLETALYAPNFTDTAVGYSKYMSEKSFLDYFIVNELARNVDGMKKSRYFNKDKDSAGIQSKLKAGPVWDFDWAWKDIWDCSYFSATDGSGWTYLINDCSPDVYSNGWYVRLLQDTNFADHLRCRYENLRNTILDTTYLFNYIDSVALDLDSAQTRHYTKWGNLGWNSGAPEVGTLPTTFQGEVDALKAWITRRIIWLDANMPGSLNGCLYTGINTTETKIAGTKIFPNPASEKINLEFQKKSPADVQIKILNVQGKEMMNVNVAKNTASISLDVSSLPAGIYFLNISAKDLSENLKLIVEGR
ncbi:MAG: CotH kinase family protein [Bacteroidia bacterium]|nr:CotH kinase family protein [Bacteroidia bacterium]